MAAKWTDFVAGAVLTAAQLNDVIDNFQDIALFNETQAAGTNGGSAVATTWTKRTLNTTNFNAITGASIASSVITLPAGTYRVVGNAPFTRVNKVKLRLQNTTDATTAVIGQSSYTQDNSDQNFPVALNGIFTIAGTKNFEFQYWALTASATTGLGTNTGAGISEVYAVIEITRIA